MLKRLFTTLAIAAALATPAFAQPAEQARFAFVIGNDLYQDAPLPTAANDAGLIADTLKSAGFDVTGARNLDPETLRTSYREFLDKVAAAGPGAVAVIYLSGYGLQFAGDNYLLPAGAEVARDSDIPLAAVRLSDLTKPLAGLPAVAKLAIFDLAHPFPPASAPGLALIEPDPGMLVAMNAAPGTVGPTERGPYGAYAQALAEMIGTPGLPIGDLFDQVRLRVASLTRGAEVPWDASRIDEPFAFFAAGPDTPPPPVSAADIEARLTRPVRDFPADQAYAAALERDTLQGYIDFLAAYPTSPYARTVRGLLAARREALIWHHTLDVGTPPAYWSYLRRYPQGPHAAEAREILGQLAAAVQPPPDFTPLDYDIPAPPPDEEVYFDARQPVFYDPDYAPPPPPAVFLPPPPAWWVLPPPPRIDRDNAYFLPGFEHHEEPAWRRPPAYVLAPPEPRFEHGEPSPGEKLTPYVAIPAAVAAGIAAGHLIKEHLGTPQKTSLPGARPPQGAPLMAPVTAPPPGPGRPGVGELPPGSSRPNLPAGHPSAGLPPAGNRPNQPNEPLPGAGGHPQHPGAGVEPRPGLPAPALKPNEPLPQHGTALPPPASRMAEPSPPPHAAPEHPQPQVRTSEPPKMTEPSPPHAASEHPQPQMRTTTELPPRGERPPQPEVHTAVPPAPQPHAAPPPQQVRQVPPPQVRQAPPAGAPAKSKPESACGRPGEPACK